MVARTVKIAACACGVCIALIAQSTPASGDYWGPPVKEHWSDNGRYFLQVDYGEVDEISLWQKTAGGPQLIWKRGYVDDIWPPCCAYVAGDGYRVVLRDLYHNVGYGEVLVFLGGHGEVLKAYELEDIISEEEILHAPGSVSSLWWSRNGWFSLINDDREFAFITQRGTVRCFDLQSGAMIEIDSEKEREIIGLATGEIRETLADCDSDWRIRAMKLAGVLGLTDSIYFLEEGLDDTSVTGWVGIGDEVLQEEMGYQLAAAEALVRLTGAEALPRIEKKLDDAGPYMQRELLLIMRGLDTNRYGEIAQAPYSAAVLEIWRRLTEHPSKVVRNYATVETIKRSDAAYIRDNLYLLDSESEEIRREAIACISQKGDATVLPLLRKAYNHDDANQTYAFRGLVRLKPPDIDEILRHALSHDDASVRHEALLELVRRGDADATAAMLLWLSEMKYHSHSEGWGTEQFRARDICFLIAELRIAEARGALEEASTNWCEDIQVSAIGALAVLGDAKALERLRGFAREGDFLRRSTAIRMLGLAHDAESIELLEEATRDENEIVRETAEEALSQIPGNAGVL